MRRVSADEARQHGVVSDSADVRLEPTADEVHRLRPHTQLHRVAARPAFQASRPNEPDPHSAAACDGP